jgi:osmoprotectant transport system substrate-binding protein
MIARLLVGSLESAPPVSPRKNWALTGWVIALSMFLSSCSPGPAGRAQAAAANNRGSIVVASFDFAEGNLLSDLYATVLKEHGYPIARAFNLGPREIVEPALQQRRVDIVPEYLASALTFITRGKARITSGGPPALYKQFRKALRPLAIDPLRMAPAQDANGIVVSDETAARYNLTEISDLKPVAPDLVFGGPPECELRPFCLAGLEETYGLHFKRFQAIDTGGPLTVRELERGQIDVGLLFTTDPNIIAKNFVLLRDDKHLQSWENIVPVVRRRVLKDYGGGVIRLIDEVTRRLTTDALRRLNAQVQIDGKPVHQVAEQWLSRQRIIE